MIRMLSVLKEKRVLLTGHTGFKGSWLAIWLHELGAELHGYSLAAQDGAASNYHSSRVGQLMASQTFADIRDRSALRSLILSIKPQVVFHLASRNDISGGYQHPYETIENNVLGTVNVLDALRNLRSPCGVICETSDRSYEGTQALTGSQMADALSGHDPCNASKNAAEMLVAAYRRAFFSPTALESHHIQIAATHTGCVTGGGDWSDGAFISDWAQALQEYRPIELRDPSIVRPWQHVLDPLSGYLMLAAAMLSRPGPAWCDTWNFGPTASNKVSVGRFAEAFAQTWNPSDHAGDAASKGSEEILLSQLLTEEAKNALDWAPRWNWKEAARRTARWHKQVCTENADARTLCVGDIEAFGATRPNASSPATPKPPGS